MVSSKLTATLLFIFSKNEASDIVKRLKKKDERFKLQVFLTLYFRPGLINEAILIIDDASVHTSFEVQENIERWKKQGLIIVHIASIRWGGDAEMVRKYVKYQEKIEKDLGS